MKVLAILALAALAAPASAGPIPETAQVFRDETYFLASQGIAIWQTDVGAPEPIWISLHDYKRSDDGKSFTALVRGYHRNNHRVKYRFSVTEIDVNCAAMRAKVGRWSTHMAGGRILEEREGGAAPPAKYLPAIVNYMCPHEMALIP